MLVYFMAIWNMLRPSGIFYGIFIWFIFPHFGLFYQEKSGNPAGDKQPFWREKLLHR
jgi:hypothetical protein